MNKAFINTPETAQDRDRTSGCGGWLESSFELRKGMEMLEDTTFDEFERLSARVTVPVEQVATGRPTRSPKVGPGIG